MLFAEALRSIGRETDTGHTLTESTPEQVRQRAADRAHWLGSNDPETARVSFALGRTYGVPRLGDAEDPLIWKERWFRTPWHSVHRGFASAAGLVTALASLAGFTFVAMLILFVKAARELAATQSLVETTNTLQLSVFPAAVVLWPALLGVRASASLGRERAAQTLTALFTVPVERSAVLRAIAAAIFIRDRRTMAFFAGVSVVGMIAGGVDSACAVAALILLTGCAAWAVAFGIWLSVQIETPARASLIFLGAWGGLLLLPWMVAPFGGSEIADRVELLCPPYALSELFVASREVTEATGTAAEMALATGLGMLALAAGFAWHAVRTFEREGK